jgi:predicted small secreted protein
LNEVQGDRKGEQVRGIFVKVLLLVAIVGMVVGAVGCETWKGAGKDVEHLGDKMQGDQPAHNP